MVTSAPKLRVAWDINSGLNQTGAELSSRLLGVECWRGRDFASSLIGKSVAGGLKAILNNNSGDYSPANTGGPLAGLLEPNGQAVRLTMTGRAAQFTIANSEYFTAGDVLDITTGDFSLFGWINPDALATAQGIVNKRDRASGTNLGYAVELQTDGTLDFLISDGTAVTTISSTTTFSTGTWYFWILTVDRDGNAQFYINAGAAEGAASVVSQNGTLANAIAFTIGAGNSSGVDRFCGGSMVSVGHTGKLLSSAERTMMYRDGDGVQYKDIGLTGDGSALKTSLNAWYDLQEESGNRADSENSNTLTDTNTVTDAEGIPNYSLWKGFLADIEPIPSTGGLNSAILTAVGSLGQVNLNKLRLAAVTNELTGTAIDRILTEANWPTDDRSIDAGKTTMTLFGLENEVRTLTALRRVEATDDGFIGESKDGRIFFEDRRHRQLPPHTVSQATFTDAPGGVLVYSDGLRELDSQSQLFHIFTLAIQTYTDVSIAVLWTLSASGADSPFIEPGETLTFWAEWPNPSSPTNAYDVIAWETPVENTDYEANTQAGGGGDDKSSQLGFTVTKFANAMKMEVINNDVVRFALTLLQARGTTRTADDPARITVEKSAAHPRTFPKPPEYLPSIAEGFDWANWKSNVFSVIQPLLEIRVNGNRSKAQMAQVLGLDLSSRITAVTANSAGLGHNEDFFIEIERHVLDPRMNTHWTTWGISAVAKQDAWTLSISKLGTETRIAQ